MESTEEQEGPGHVLVGFSGGDQAGECICWKLVERAGKYVKELSRVYRGTLWALIATRFRNWPQDPFVLASYAFPAPKVIMRCGTIFDEGIGNLHFTDDHTCYAFIGYREGALQSGISASRRIILRDGLSSTLP
jgi:monoamine oxidase